MKFYFVCSAAKSQVPVLHEVGANQYLVSYWSYRNVANQDPNDDVFLDSGAFTAFTKKKEILVENYGKYLEQWKHMFRVYANLDVIGDPERTFDNQEKLEALGHSPLPTIHYGADLKWLHLYAKKYDYIALGGLVPHAKHTVELNNWLNTCFKELIPYVQDKKLKVHGFGVGSPAILKKYPFYSSDSSGWVVGGTFGTLVTWNPATFAMETGAHYSEKATYLEKGASLKATESHQERSKHNIKQYLEMEKDITRLWASRGIVWTK